MYYLVKQEIGRNINSLPTILVFGVIYLWFQWPIDYLLANQAPSSGEWVIRDDFLYLLTLLVGYLGVLAWGRKEHFKLLQSLFYFPTKKSKIIGAHLLAFILFYGIFSILVFTSVLLPNLVKEINMSNLGLIITNWLFFNLWGWLVYSLGLFLGMLGKLYFDHWHWGGWVLLLYLLLHFFLGANKGSIFSIFYQSQFLRFGIVSFDSIFYLASHIVGTWLLLGLVLQPEKLKKKIII